MALAVLHALFATYVCLMASLGVDVSARTVLHLPGAFSEHLKIDSPIGIYACYIWCPIHVTALLALGLVFKVTDATFRILDLIIDTNSRIIRFFGLTFTWRFNWETRAATLSFADYIRSAVLAFININPYAVLVAPIANACSKLFQQAKSSRWTAWATKMMEGAGSLANGLVISPSVHIAKAMYSMYMDTAATFTSLAISSWVAASTLPIYFMWATYQHGLRGAIGLTAAHGISFAPSSVAPMLHRTTATFLRAIGIDCPKLMPATKAEGKPTHSAAVNVTASSTVPPP